MFYSPLKLLLRMFAQLDTDDKVAFAQRHHHNATGQKQDWTQTFLKYLLLSRPIQQRIRAKRNWCNRSRNQGKLVEAH